MVALGCLPGPPAACSGGPGRSAGRRGRLAQDARRRCGGVVALAAPGPALEPVEDPCAPPGDEHDPAERGEVAGRHAGEGHDAAAAAPGVLSEATTTAG